MELSPVTRTRAANWAVALALAVVAFATLVPISPTTGGITPFWCLGCGDDALADAVVNVALFVPLGWATSRAGMPRALGLGVVLATTIGVEWLQYAFVPGRMASVSDILTNTLGGMAGMTLPTIQRKVVETRGRARRASMVYGVLLVVCLGVGEAMQAVPLPRTLCWTEGRADMLHYVPFTGSLRAVEVAGTPVTLHGWRDVPVRQVVEITVDLLSGRPDTGLAHIVIAWLPSGRGWMWLEQRNRDLHLHLASASDGARLRGHSVWLRDAMPATASERVSVRLEVRPFSYGIVLRTTAGVIVREARIGPGDGWRLFTPEGHELGRWTALLTAAWMAALLAPLGYLAAVRSRRAVAVAAVGASVSLLVLSIGSGGTWLNLPGWCGAAIGFLVGSQGSVALRRRWGPGGPEVVLPRPAE